MVQAIIDATNAVIKAEGSKLQLDVDSAIILVNALPDGTDKTNLTNRLNVVQAIIDAPIVPLAPQNLITLGATETTVDLMWDNAADSIGVAGYKIYRDGVEVGESTTTDYTDTGLTAGTTYLYTVKAYAAADNISEASNEISVTTSGTPIIEQPDTEVPTTPANLIMLGATETTVDLMWDNATDNVGVTGYRIYRDGVEVGTTTTTDYTDTGLTAGTTYIYTVKTYDAAGNTSDASSALSATTSLAPDTQAPTATRKFNHLRCNLHNGRLDVG